MSLRLPRFSSQLPARADYYSTRLLGPEYQVSQNFKLGEFASRDGEHVVIIHAGLVDACEEVRVIVDAFSFASAFRSVRHNSAIGGARESKHLYGTAVDPYSRKVSAIDLAWAAHAIGCGGVGVELDGGRVHFDVEGEGRRWLYTDKGVEVIPVAHWVAKVQGRVNPNIFNRARAVARGEDPDSAAVSFGPGLEVYPK